jgi:hypothetical protein
MTTIAVLSRRALFSTSAAALAASTIAATPTLAAIPALMPTAIPEVDARLWELARALGPAEEQWSDAYTTFDAARTAYMKQAPKKSQPFVGAAAEAWEAITDEVAERVGYHEAQEAHEEAEERASAIHDELRELAAASLIGLQAKAEAVKALAYDRDFESYVEEFYANNGKSPESMALVVVRDLLRMAAAKA